MFNLLVVEDDVLLSDMIKKLLSQNNYEVVSAYSGSEALLIIEKKHFDLILLDLLACFAIFFQKTIDAFS